MTQDPFTIALLGGMGGIILSMVGAWAKGQVERIGNAEHKTDEVDQRAQARHDAVTDRDMNHVGEIASLRAEVNMLKETGREERNRCADLAERVARTESFQAWAEPLLERATAGLEHAVAFQARFDERLITLFKGLGAITQRVERLLPQQAVSAN